MLIAILMWIVSLLALAGAALVAQVSLSLTPPVYLPLVASGLGVAFALVANPLTASLLGFWRRWARTFATLGLLTVLAAGVMAYAVYKRIEWASERQETMNSQMRNGNTQRAIAGILAARGDEQPGYVSAAGVDFTTDTSEPDTQTPEVLALFAIVEMMTPEYSTQEGFDASLKCVEALNQLTAFQYRAESGADVDQRLSWEPDWEGSPEDLIARLPSAAKLRRATAIWTGVRAHSNGIPNGIMTAGDIRIFADELAGGGRLVPLPEYCLSRLPDGALD